MTEKTANASQKTGNVVLQLVLCREKGRWCGMRFHDPEWEDAENANEKMIYYQQQTKTGVVIKRYKPSLANLVMERTGWTLIPLKESGAERKDTEDL